MNISATTIFWNPVVDEQWVKYNPDAADYMHNRLVNHHEGGGAMGVAIPEQVHRDYFSELHPYVNSGKAIKGLKVSGLLGGALNVLGNVGMFSGLFSGDPESWINAFGFGEPHQGDIKKDWAGTNLYVQIMSIQEHYIPVLDANGQPVTDQKTGQPKYRLGSKTVTANIYSGYILNEDTKKYEGVNKVGSRTEEWQYDDKGNRIQSKSYADPQHPTPS